jgi:hypothetical protein
MCLALNIALDYLDTYMCGLDLSPAVSALFEDVFCVTFSLLFQSV